MISAWTTKFTGTPPGNDANLRSDTNGIKDLPSNWDTSVSKKDAYLITINLNSSEWSTSKHPEGG
jgi:hypothetical protein